MQKLDRVLDSYDMSAAARIDSIDHRRQGCRFAGTGRASHEYQSTTFLGNAVDDRRQSQFRGGFCLVRDNTQYNTHRAALLKDVRAESTQALDVVSDINFRCLFETLFLAV